MSRLLCQKVKTQDTTLGSTILAICMTSESISPS
jgi:hypothetical protein